ncbi:MAG: hypothetical protein HQL96_05785 [Magnetococcales bacterium]|nr:hypothetical protein [Magnetococcales bacterium]
MSGPDEKQTTKPIAPRAKAVALAIGRPPRPEQPSSPAPVPSAPATVAPATKPEDPPRRVSASFVIGQKVVEPRTPEAAATPALRMATSSSK